jgi:hypothetical protein
MQLTQVVFEQSAKLEADGEIDPLDVMRMTRALANLTGTKERLTQDAGGSSTGDEGGWRSGQEGTITAEDIAEARKAIFGSDDQPEHDHSPRRRRPSRSGR